MGTFDWTEPDRLKAESVRPMRYAAALSHCLLHRLLEEAKRIRLQAIPFRKALLML